MRILSFLILLFVPCVVYGASAYDTAEEHGIVDSLQSAGNTLLSRDVEEIRNFIKSEDADFITGISSMSDEEQLGLMRGWLAKKTFKFYYDKYMSEIKAQGEKTGRAIKTKTYGTADNVIEQLYWLDRGNLDKQECEQDILERRACDYPDGFEEYEISHETITSKDKNRIIESFIVDKDDIAANSRKFISVTLTVSNINSYNAKYFNYTVSASVTTEKYDEYHKRRNQEAADIRAGKYVQRAKGYVTNDDGRKWDSDWLPDAAVTDLTIDYNYSHNKE